ncbi:MAG: DNA starvation/stationary phase protection protein Dps [Phycisphaeraceae bacterium]|nr:DNA starvation/stationary phase protection protein Dps [Phycisphaeraceae bacterium]
MKTHNTLSKKIKSDSIDLLQARLADSLDAYSHAKQAHWNVRGPGFIAIHELFDKVADAVAESADAIAERLATLGGSPSGTARDTAKNSTLKAYPHGIANEHKHVEALAASLSSLATGYRDAIDQSNKIGDAVTCDLFTRLTGELDKYIWFIESHNA